MRAVVSVVPQLDYPPADDLPDPDPNVPPPILPPFPLPGDGYLLRETAQRLGGRAADGLRRLRRRPAGEDRSDPGAAARPVSGDGWAVGGWSGDADAAGRGTSASGGAGSAIRARVRTAAISRYGVRRGDSPPNGATPQPVPMPAGPIRLAVAGHAAVRGTLRRPRAASRSARTAR